MTTVVVLPFVAVPPAVSLSDAVMVGGRGRGFCLLTRLKLMGISQWAVMTGMRRLMVASWEFAALAMVGEEEAMLRARVEWAIRAATIGSLSSPLPHTCVRGRHHTLIHMCEQRPRCEHC